MLSLNPRKTEKGKKKKYEEIKPNAECYLDVYLKEKKKKKSSKDLSNSGVQRKPLV